MSQDRFRISWDGSAYRVSAPNVGNCEVVSAVYHDAEVERLRAEVAIWEARFDAWQNWRFSETMRAARSARPGGWEPRTAHASAHDETETPS